MISGIQPNFDRIAPFYDRIASLAFFGSILRSQKFFLDRIPQQANVLVLGGGTGEFLLRLIKVNPLCQVWYIDSSAKMICRARRKMKNSSQLHFIHGTEEIIPMEIKYDAVITFFYLDLFGDDKLQHVVEKIRASLRTNALWLASDFVTMSNVWSPLFLKLMYAFFKWACGIEAKKLPDWKNHLSNSGFTQVYKNPFYAGFIESCVYR